MPLTLPPVVVGCMRLLSWGLDTPRLADWIGACVDLGLSAFDHADCYGDYGVQAAFGTALARQPGLRDRLQLLGKVGVQLVSPGRPDTRVKHYDLSGAHIIAATERSLSDLGTDRLDLLMLHRPDPLMQPDEIAEAFARLKRDGKVLAFGVSNFTASQANFLADALDEPLLANQVNISLENPAALFDGTLDACRRLGMAPMAWSPLGGGGLFGGETRFDRLRQMLWQVAEALGGAAPDQVALAWLLRHPAGIRPVVGTGRLDRLAGAAGAARLRLNREQWYALLAAATGQDVP